jgi:HSP90 family molecular chaperone
MSTNLERLLKAGEDKMSETKPTLEVNPQHPLVRAFKHESDEKRFADWSHIRWPAIAFPPPRRRLHPSRAAVVQFPILRP